MKLKKCKSYFRSEFINHLKETLHYKAILINLPYAELKNRKCKISLADKYSSSDIFA